MTDATLYEGHECTYLTNIHYHVNNLIIKKIIRLKNISRYLHVIPIAMVYTNAIRHERSPEC